MRPTDLTSERVAVDGGTATPVRWRGEAVLVRDDAGTALRCIAALQDSDASEGERRERVLSLLFVDWRDAWAACDYDARELARLVAEVAWDVLGVDIVGDRPHEEPLWDPAEDAALIRASLRMAYGIDWDAERGEVSFAEFVALVAGCPTDTPIGRAIYYRDPRTRPKATRHNRRQVEEWQRLHRAYALRGDGGATRAGRGSAGTNEAMDGAFAALSRRAR